MANSGPIPGANFTSDTKNYPWHQPPEFTDISDALDKIVERIGKEKAGRKLAALAELGLPLYRIATLTVMEGVSAGKWTVDMALLLAGPVCKIIEILCVQYGIEYELGLEEKDDFRTGLYAKNRMELKAGTVNKAVKEAMPDIKAQVEEQEQSTGGEPDLMQEGFASMTREPPAEEEGMM